ncbi:MAG: hypothetical protein JWL73_3813 [Actinomycetia bacterium]|nr:hypothetical protein [Actinomycetes bacterium]
MDDEGLAGMFEANRTHLRAVAYRMLGSETEAEDAVQEAWIRFNRSDTDAVDNLGGWLTTVVSRICLDMLRSRRTRREESLESTVVELFESRAAEADPEGEAVLADSVGPALLVVLEMLTPGERLAFVLHDMFGLPFEEIAPIVGRSTAAARQLASRGRRRVQGATNAPEVDLTRQREVVEAFIAASRTGDFDALLALLDPDVVLRVDGAAAGGQGSKVIRGAEAVGGQARLFSGRARFARVALIDGTVGVVILPRGRVTLALVNRVADGRIVELEVIGEPDRLAALDVTYLDT